MLEDARNMITGLQRALTRLPGVVVDTLHIYGSKFPSLVKRDWSRQQYADEKGKLQRLGKITKVWKARKRKANFDPRRGHATRQSVSAIGSKRAVKKTADGFEFDVAVPAAQLEADYRPVGGKVVRVADYLPHYVNQKAPGFPSFAETQVDEMVDREAVQAMNTFDDELHEHAARMEQLKLKRSTYQRYRVRLPQRILPEVKNRA